jgi:hypothetical protein
MSRRRVLTRAVYTILSIAATLLVLPLAIGAVGASLPFALGNYKWVGWALIGASILLVAAQALQDGTPQLDYTSPNEEHYLERLASETRRQWAEEATLRQLYRPAPIRLRWQKSRRLIGAKSHVSVPEVGDLAGIAPLLRQLEHRRMVILGDPGSGKSVAAMLMTLALLEERLHGDPVPLLLSASSWSPNTEHLHSWLAKRLEEDYKVPRGSAAATDSALKLVLDARVMPVLDGLDEMPLALRVRALRAIDECHGERPIVATCRTAEYEEIVLESDQILSGSAVIEMQPVLPEDAVAFLAAGVPIDSPRWSPLFTHLLESCGTPVTIALSNPFAVSLVRYIYADRETTTPRARPAPGELLNPRSFPTANAVETHLVDAFVRSAYSPRSWPGLDRGTREFRTHSLDSVRRWLSFIAAHLNRLNTTDLAVWDLGRAVNPRDLELAARALLSLILGVSFGCSFLWMFGPGGAITGALIGLSVSVIAASMLGLTDNRVDQEHTRRPLTWRWFVTRSLEALGAGALVGSAAGVEGGIILGIRVGAIATVIAFLVFGPLISILRSVGKIGRKLFRGDVKASSYSLVGRLQDLLSQLAYALALATLFGCLLGAIAGIDGGVAEFISTSLENFQVIVLVSALLLGLGLVGRRRVPERVNLGIFRRPVLLARMSLQGVIDGSIYGVVIASINGVMWVAIDMLFDILRDRPIAMTESSRASAMNLMVLSVAVGLVAGLARALARWLNAPVELISAPNPEEVLRASRKAAFTWAMFSLLVLTGMALLGAFKFSEVESPSKPALAVGYGAPIAIAGFMLALTASNWGELMLARSILAIRRRLPLRLLRFLKDGRARGVFRVAGPVYQFRHTKLTMRLVTPVGAELPERHRRTTTAS